MAELILIRHGESVANSERRFTLRDDEPLTATGVEQALKTGQSLAHSYSPVALYASRLRRALQTAHEIGRSIGLEPSTVEGLHEQSFGELRGAAYESWYDIHGPRPHPREAWRRSPPGGESLTEVAERSGRVLDSLARRHALLLSSNYSLSIREKIMSLVSSGRMSSSVPTLSASS